MFTGLVQQVATVRSVEARGGNILLVIDLGDMTREIAPGDSVLVQGVCLTVTRIEGTVARFDVIAETAGRTTLAEMQRGSKVNIELSLRMSDRLGGHLVSGHIDGVGTVRAVRKGPGEWRIAVTAPREVSRYLIEKGSIAFDGISLTLAAVTSRGFEVAVIPHTLEATTLKGLRPGDRVNLEADMIGKWVVKILGAAAESGGELADRLKKGGFFE